MNTHEGIRRIVIAGRLITLATVALIVFLAICPQFNYLFIGVPLYKGVVLGVLVWLAGWIMAGFNKS